MSKDPQLPEAKTAFLAEVVDGLYNCISVSQAVREGGRIIDFQCVFVNRTYLESLRLTREEVLSKRLLERYPGLRESGLFDHFVDVVETGKPIDLEQRIEGDGLDLHVRLIVKKFGDGFLAAFHDIARRKRGETELKRLNQDLEFRVAERTAELSEAQKRLQQALELAQQSNRAKGEFLAMVSHDLRSPLTAIQGYAGLLASEGVSKEQTEQLNVIDQCAEGLLRLLDDLLRFSRLEAGQFKLENEPFLLSDLFTEILDVFRPAAMQKKIGLRIEKDSPLPEIVVGDAAQLRRILANLVGNALKFTEHGEVLVRARVDSSPAPEKGWTLQAEVIDTGKGLDPAQARRLFQPYIQGAEGLRRPDGGGGRGPRPGDLPALMRAHGWGDCLRTRPGQRQLFFFPG